MPEQSLVLVDARVARLHPKSVASVAARAKRVVVLRAGEQVKSMSVLEKVASAGIEIPRSGTLVCIGGGTLGDLATVAAHVIKRGIGLIHVPSTLLAAVDSSIGGKGAIHGIDGRHPVKNAIGVFHYPDACWICPELFETLSPRQLREGAIEAWKMVVCLDAPKWRRYRRIAPKPLDLIRVARALKARVCERDPYERTGLRAVLNFGHTFGHVIESVTGFRVSHGDAVGMGMLCALDVGRELGVTPNPVADEVEVGLREGPGALPRAALARALSQIGTGQIASALRADKKAVARGELRMVLLRAVGDFEIAGVADSVWRPLLRRWKRSTR